jgi:Tripartite tricarboxylate transporter TctB family
MNPERRERYKDLLLAAVLLFVGVGGFIFINPTGAKITDGPGGLSWRTLPFIYSGSLLCLVLLFIAATVYDLWLIHRKQAPRSILGSPPVVRHDPLADLRRVVTVGCLFGYAASIKLFGFAISTPVLLFVMLAVLGRRNWPANLSVSLIGAIVLWVLFVGVLKLPLTGEYWDPLTPLLEEFYAMSGAR